MLGRRWLSSCTRSKISIQYSPKEKSPLDIGNLRRFLFQTWFGSGPPPPGLPAFAPPLLKESRRLVVFATKRGRELGCGTPSGVAVDSGAVFQLELDSSRCKDLWNMNVPFSAAFGAAGVPGAFGIENLAKETGLNAGFLTLPTRESCLLSVRLASDSEPP